MASAVIDPIRSMISGRATGGESPTTQPPSSSASAACQPLRGVGVQREQRLAGGDGFAGPAVDAHAGAELHALTGSRAARAEPPHRQSHRHRVDVAHRAAARCRDGLGMRTDRQRLGEVAALRGHQRPEPVHRGAVAQRLRRVDAVDAGQRRASRGPAPASAPRRRPARRRPAPPATRRPRRRCRPPGPAGRPCRSAAPGWARRGPCPSSTMVRASSRGSVSVFRNAPDPTLTSSTRASAPSASFLLITELAISGSDSTVRGDVAQRVDLAVGGRQVARGEDGRADVDQLLADRALMPISAVKPGDGLELVQRAAGVPESAAGGLRHRAPHAATRPAPAGW